MIETSHVHHCRACGRVHICQERAQPLREPAVPVPRLREQQGSQPEGAPQRGAQVRGAAGPIWNVPRCGGGASASSCKGEYPRRLPGMPELQRFLAVL